MGIVDSERHQKVVNMPIGDIEFVFSRMRFYANNACEIFTRNRKSFFFVMESVDARTNFYQAIPKVEKTGKSSGYDFWQALRKACNAVYQTMPAAELRAKSNVRTEWTSRRLSTFEYLYFLNILANRSFNDLSQYPIYPWIIRDFEAATLDLTDPAVFRDLALPVGALSEQRLQLDRQAMSAVTDPTESCLYRSHYSTAAAVVNFQIRMEPFTSLHILISGGLFGHPDKLFTSIADTWRCVTGRPGDYRELIPEFYTTADLFENVNRLDLADVELPAWAKNGHEFVDRHRQALESEYVRARIHLWIDLIFGCHQRSAEKNNLFHRFSYADCIDHITDKQMRRTIKHFCANFGCCPVKLFKSPHKRSATPSALSTIADAVFERPVTSITFFGPEICMDEDGEAFRVIPGGSNEIPSVRYKRGEFSSLLYLKQCNQFVALSPNGAFASVGAAGIISHEGSEITCFSIVDADTIVTGGSDSLVHVWSVPNCELIGTISVDSLTILSIDGCSGLNLVAFVDSSHQMFLCWCYERKQFLSWKVGCDVDCQHRLLLLQNGSIALTCEMDTRFEIRFFNLRGEEQALLPMKGRVVRLFSIRTRVAETFIVVAKENENVTIISGADFQICKVLEQRPYPELVSPIDDTRRLLMVVGTEQGLGVVENKLEVVSF
jgi:hypothetical protein